MHLSTADRAMLGGEAGAGIASAMDILCSYAQAVGADHLLDIAGAHIDGCLYHGQVSLDFVARMAAGNAQVAVPTTLNVGSLDLIHPDIMRVPQAEATPARRLMLAHQALGCLPSFTCAPYQTMFRPRFGEQIAWGESNAIVFANSVIGARTNRYGDFIDLCCALTGRAPACGLHLDANRAGRALFRLEGTHQATDSLYVGIGLIVGRMAGEAVPVIDGLPTPNDEDQLKALGAAAASTGSVALFHAVGITPEAPDLPTATHGLSLLHEHTITAQDVAQAVRSLSTVPDGTPLAAICLGTPHYSYGEWQRLLALLHEIAPASGIPIYVNTGRETLARLQAEDALDGVENLIPVADTCTYVTAILEDLSGAVMTASGKWAHYAPGNIGVRVAFGELRDCILSAAAGKVVRA